ncbi:MAG: hypothetical protein ACXVDB_02510 [Tumebacillaceae bacterium]
MLNAKIPSSFMEKKHESEEAGVYTERFDKEAPVYNLRKLFQHCDQHGIQPSELSTEEMKKFEVPKNESK